ncbi:MAG: bifunctional (p)ppGpp synthetase/guanosine-3',5'-bis(diphosphate) 3'-pyrophosphohydrolase [Bacteroidales bacterium]|nr:bifunctional (p)ppGpp synthetase/guanosine-3',5'-bis(diphosphate) 3'-pyrophosphohydrolase [Bacteroidales bacterium]
MENNINTAIKESIEHLFSIMEERVSSEDMVRIREAYQLASEAHKDQKRKTGEPYIIHPIAVARIIAEELELGANPVIAAFLHDVVEDSNYTIEDIRKLFGNDVAFLVGVVTKQKKNKNDQSKQIANYRQILASVHYDIRAMLIKLADRMHNMRTLSSMRPDKQMKIAGETDYFYAPLANRLGLYHVKLELENLSFKYRCPREYTELENLLNEERINNAEYIDSFLQKITSLLEQNGINVRTEVRYRMPYNVWRKMHTTNNDYYHVGGKHYIRIIYPNNSPYSEKDMCLRIYSILTDTFKERPGSVSNYINAPKENGYQSFHVKLLSDFGEWEELHISSERMIRNSRLGCAAERTEQNVRHWLEKFKSILKDAADHTKDVEFMEGITTSFYNDDIMVFTPKGKGIILPKNATVLDFAYEVHSKVGDHAQYARINGRFASIKTVLKRGDCIEVITNDNVEPEESWLKAVSTYRAIKSIKHYLASKEKIGFKRCEKCHPIPGDEVIGFKATDDTITIHRRNCPVAIRVASQRGDSIVAVDFNENENFLYPVRIKIISVDRFHLLSDLIHCITENQHLSMYKLAIECKDHIVTCAIDFNIHSERELTATIENISAIDGVEEVQRIEIE